MSRPGRARVHGDHRSRRRPSPHHRLVPAGGPAVVTVTPDDWLSGHVGLRCFNADVSSCKELNDLTSQLEAGSYLTARSAKPLSGALLPVVETMVKFELRRPFARA